MAGVIQAAVTLTLVGALSAEPLVQLSRESRDIGAFLAGMFGFASIEAFRKSFEDE
ncbi:hypothetical protein PN498_28410 [Oscillatoria sp. CS-180]|uniref:hypothetical protein n=1 Tax=Oscillatoria sp. CS-180 TaxID=3021720 RepID=UPI00232F6F3D|nr:hypothetical protein [Oscillatoria sp. CS-180]MDB9529943.1 hypothetical protein [Oscillatoria sp. CS-180]